MVTFASGRCLALTFLIYASLYIGTSSALAQDVDRRPQENHVTYVIRPSETDPSISHFDEPNYVIFDRNASQEAELVVFLPGTNGMPHDSLLLRVIADQGYRVIGLEYNDSPAVSQTCPRDPQPSCSADFRQKRIFGTNVTSVVDNTPAESIVNRLTKLLLYLEQQHPNEDWGQYLASGDLNWNHIVISGMSQGAGMAAYIAKKKPVARVVLFSSPWDFLGRSRRLAPWIFGPSVTPPDRWFAEFHRREKTADLIARAYEGLRIPETHIRVFDLDLPPGEDVTGNNPFHASTIRNPAYVPQWRFLFGRSAASGND
ncbi:MAG: hypothetical protein JO356_21715 [Acidobacteria bacterium]|nr:hypothetical protein [Acidobacteriota bacterium]